MAKLKHKPSPEIAKERADRVKRLRGALRLSRPKFCKKYANYGITTSALQGWEDVRWYGLTENGANMLAQAFQDEGLNVTVEWLMYGIGESPISDSFPFPQPKGAAKLSEKGFVANELQIFHQHVPHAVDTIIMDDGLSPWLMPGDYVAGARYFDKDIAKAVGQISIVQTLSGNLLVRMVQSGKDADCYTLTCTNPHTTVKQSTLKNEKLFSAAPILWIRKLTLN
jgi:hypothetical protein